MFKRIANWLFKRYANDILYDNMDLVINNISRNGFYVEAILSKYLERVENELVDNVVGYYIGDDEEKAFEDTEKVVDFLKGVFKDVYDIRCKLHKIVLIQSTSKLYNTLLSILIPLSNLLSLGVILGEIKRVFKT